MYNCMLSVEYWVSDIFKRVSRAHPTTTTATSVHTSPATATIITVAKYGIRCNWYKFALDGVPAQLSSICPSAAFSATVAVRP